MMEPRPTREKILDLADEFIRLRGYNAFSYKDISDVLGVKPAAIHYHFPTKEALGAATLAREITDFRTHSTGWEALPYEEQLRNLVALFAGYRERGLICIVGSMCPDFDTLPPAVQEQLKMLSVEILDWVTTVLEEGRCQKALRFDGAAADRALLLISMLMSALLLSRVHGEELFYRMTTQLQKDLIAS
ncbi:TetR/AcrR family transcriptional regulator [Dinghuibacter silviterrae]|uniref:TetR family transcriptional regulator n=1 Tax=Dinghuibacter silviterrae TaxID=1539049 RepID=A0A4R8DSS3_9BACT|nr:TetR/AcrR family transcriptional regulator [Dinghuibacter silviterrae]TDX01324.1 TetR family transcriptional regulator [Dinghuibacter silviterrae]